MAYHKRMDTIIEIRPTIQSDFLEVCDRINDKTVKAFTVLNNGAPVAIAGVTIENGRFIAFSEIKEGVSGPKISIWKVAKQLAHHIKEFNLPAVTAPDSNSRFLQSIGLECLNDKEKIYRI